MDAEVGKGSEDSKEVVETPTDVAEPMETGGDKQQVRGVAGHGGITLTLSAIVIGEFSTFM